jgi:DNA-binding CsgD family transcriptional regulator
VALSPLSADAVATLAAPTSVDPVELHRTTGGNPFYVTEVLAGGAGDIPPTVRDAVHARVARLTVEAQELLDAAAVLPPPAPLRLLETVAGERIAALDECLTAGLLTENGGRLAFRHELSRIAIEEALPPNTRIALHRAALTALADDAAPDPARLAHHAEASGDAQAVLQFAPAAAQHAASVGAHREAVAQYERALRFGNALPPAERAELLDSCAAECRAIGEFRRAIDLRRQAAEEHERIGDIRRQAASLCAMALLIWAIASADEAHAVVSEAIAVLATDSDAPELLAAFDVLAALRSGQHDRKGVREWAQRGGDLAERIGQPGPIDARLYRSLVDFGRGAPPNELEDAVEAARAVGDENRAALGYGLLALGAVRSRRHELAERYIDTGLEYSTDRDLTGHTPFVQAWLAALELQQGRWAEAEASAELVLRGHGFGPATAVTLTTLARLRIRRAHPAKDQALEDARLRAGRSGELWLLAPAASATAEAAWLDGRPEEVADATDAIFEAIVQRGETWVAAELASWRRRAGIHDDAPDWFPEPYALEVGGDPLAAATLWDELGCPYEAALARADADDEDALRVALDQLRELGAHPAAAIVARRLRKRGAKGLPRGPRPTTRDNPAGLTSREVEVLALVAEGLRNGDIAQRLFLSEKTVAHHVSAILRKLDVRTRGEAGAAVVRLGLTFDQG